MANYTRKYWKLYLYKTCVVHIHASTLTNQRLFSFSACLLHTDYDVVVKQPYNNLTMFNNLTIIRALFGHIVSTGFFQRHDSLKRLLAQSGDIPGDNRQLGFWLCGLLPVDSDIKQDLLELKNAVQRLTSVLALTRSCIRCPRPSTQHQHNRGQSQSNNNSNNGNGDGNGQPPHHHRQQAQPNTNCIIS